jgi:hypothetical protein
MYPCCEYTLLCQFNASITPLTPSLLAPFFQQLSIHIAISSTFTDVTSYDIDALSFSFPFPPFLSSI